MNTSDMLTSQFMTNIYNNGNQISSKIPHLCAVTVSFLTVFEEDQEIFSRNGSAATSHGWEQTVSTVSDFCLVLVKISLHGCDS